MNPPFKTASLACMFLLGLSVAVQSAPADSTMMDYTKSGDAKAARGDLKGAIADYDQAIKNDPELLAMTYYRRGLAKKADQDYFGAIDDFKHALTLDPKLADAYNNLGLLDVMVNRNNDQALSDFDQALELNPKFIEARMNRAWLKQTMGKYVEPLNDYTNLLAFDPQNATAHYQRSVLEKEIGDATAALADRKQALALNPKLGAVFYKSGVAREAGYDFEGALADYSSAIDLDPKLAAAYMHRGYVKENQSSFDSVEEMKAFIKGTQDDFDRAVELDPKNVEAWLYRGRYMIGRDVKGALDDFSHVIALDPENAFAWCYRSMVKEANGDLRGAEADYNHSLQVDPEMKMTVSFDPAFTGDLTKIHEIPLKVVLKNLSKHDRAVYNYGNDYALLNVYLIDDSGKRKLVFPLGLASFSGRRMEALAPGESRIMKSYLPVTSLRPNAGKYIATIRMSSSTDVRNADSMEIRSAPFAPSAHQYTALDYAAIADDFAQNFNAKNAIPNYDRAIELDPKNATLYYKRGLMKEMKLDLDMAIADYDSALAIDPDLAEACNHRGFLRAINGNLQPALADYNHALEIDPKFGEAWLNRARLKLTMGDLEGAEYDCGKAIIIDPNDALAWYHLSAVEKTRGDEDGGEMTYKRSLQINPRLSVAASFDTAFTGDITQWKGEIPLKIEMKNISSKNEYVMIAGEDSIVVRIFGIDSSGKRVSLSPENSYQPGKPLQNTSPGQNYSFKASMSADFFRPDIRQYVVCVEAYTTSDRRTADVVPIYSPPFVPPAAK